MTRSETGRFSGVLPAQRPHAGPVAATLENWQLEDQTKLALVFEAVQSRPFPESWHDYWKQYFKSCGRRICLPDSPKWRYRQNYDVNKMAGVNPGARTHFSVEYRHHLGPRMDSIVGKTYQTYNSLPPCQEIDIYHNKLSLIDNFVSKYPISVTPTGGRHLGKLAAWGSN